MPKCFGESKFVTLVEISLLLLNHLLVEVSPCGASGSSSKAYTLVVLQNMSQLKDREVWRKHSYRWYAGEHTYDGAHGGCDFE